MCLVAEFVINNLRFTFIIIKVKTCLPCSPHITKLNSKNKLKKANSNNSLFILIYLTLSPYLSRSIHGAYSLSVSPNRLLYSISTAAAASSRPYCCSVSIVLTAATLSALSILLCELLDLFIFLFE